MTKPLVQIVYDGECPFCSSYVKLQRLKSSYSVELINAREGHPLLDEIRMLGLNLDEGMVVKTGDSLVCGADAMHQLAVMGSTDGLVRRMANWFFTSPRRSRFLYPVLRLGRNFTLWILGRRGIDER